MKFQIGATGPLGTFMGTNSLSAQRALARIADLTAEGCFDFIIRNAATGELVDENDVAMQARADFGKHKQSN